MATVETPAPSFVLPFLYLDFDFVLCFSFPINPNSTPRSFRGRIEGPLYWATKSLDLFGSDIL